MHTCAVTPLRAKVQYSLAQYHRNLNCKSEFHAAAFTPFECEFRCPSAHCHPLLSASWVHHGFTEYTVCALTSLEAKV